MEKYVFFLLFTENSFILSKKHHKVWKYCNHDVNKFDSWKPFLISSHLHEFLRCPVWNVAEIQTA